jgi:hypothetical protein
LKVQLQTSDGPYGGLFKKMVKREQVEVETLSEWIKAAKSLIQIRIGKFRRSMSTKATSVLKDPEVAETMSTIHDTYVVVPADKASTNIVFICKKGLHC